MSAAALGYPDFQRITQWFGAPLDQAAAYALGAGAKVVGPLDVRSFASVVVCVKPTGGNVTVTVTQLVPGGPAALATSSSFVVNDDNVIFEAFVLLAGEVTVTFQGTTPGETIAYAIVPANTNVNAEVAALTQLGFQHNDAVVATETSIDLEDAAPIGWTFLDDPANLRMKITPTLRQNGAATGSLYRWDGAAWTPTAGVIVDDTARKVTLGGDTNLYRSAAGVLTSDNVIQSLMAGASQPAIQAAGLSAGGGAFAVKRTADTVYRGVIYDDFKHEWGAGGSSARDTSLYRAAAGVLQTNGSFTANGGNITASGSGSFLRVIETAGTALALAFQIPTDTQLRYQADTNGKSLWGAGGASAPDTNLYRGGAALLKTDGAFYAVGDVVANYGGATSQVWLNPSGVINFASPADTNLYRAAAAILQTDGDIEVRGGSAYRIRVGYVASAAQPGFQLGTTYDVNLYRVAAGQLATDGTLFAQYSSSGRIYLGSSSTVATILFSSLADTNLYRAAAAVLKSDGALQLGKWLQANQGAATAVDVGTLDSGSTAAAGLLLGGDTYLQRSAAGVMQTGPSADRKTVQRHASAGVRHMESGLVNVAGSSTAVVTFAKAFASAPNVVVSTNGGNGKSPYVLTVSATQVTLGNFDTTAQNLTWIAEGPD